MQLLLVEDDRRLGALLDEWLTQRGFAVRQVRTLTAAEDALVDAPPDVMVLDLGLPDGDGLDWLVELRRRWDGPLLVATARGEPEDEVTGLRRGADDYLAKPIHPERLLARIQALLRRTRTPAREIVTGPLRIDAANRVVERAGTPISLTTAEFDLLWTLARRAGQVVARETLYRELRGIAWDGVDRSIDLRVSRLRKLIGDDPRDPALLKTVRGTGYLWVST